MSASEVITGGKLHMPAASVLYKNISLTENLKFHNINSLGVIW